MMRSSYIATVAVLALGTALPSHAAEKPRLGESEQNQPKKVWTNDDLDRLRERGLISIVGPPADQVAKPVAETQSAPIYTSRLDDPRWYAQEAADLQSELEKREDALSQQQRALSFAADRITQPGAAMNQNNAGVTPEAGIAVLQAQVQEVRTEIDELNNLARQHDIPPGVLRG